MNTMNIQDAYLKAPFKDAAQQIKQAVLNRWVLRLDLKRGNEVMFPRNSKVGGRAAKSPP